MEDEDVDNINSSNVTAVDRKIDDPINIKKDVKKCVLPEDTCAEGESEKDASINKLKKSINCNDKDPPNSLMNCKESSGDSLATSRQKVNGEVDKNENVTSLGEPCVDAVLKDVPKCVNDKDVSEETLMDGTQETLKDVTKEPVKDVTKETVNDATKEAVKDVTKEPVKDVTKEPVKEVTKETVKDVTKEPVKNVTKETVKDVLKEPVKDVTKEAVKDVTKETVNDVTKEAVKDVTKEPVKDVSKETVKDVTKEAVKDVTKETVKDVTKEPVKDVTKETVSDVTKEPVKDVTKETVKDVTKEPVKDVTKETVKDVTKEPVKDVTKEPVKDVTKEPVKDVRKETVNDVTKEPVKDGTKEPVKDVTKETVMDVTKEVTKETVKDVTKEPVKNVTKETVKDVLKETVSNESKVIGKSMKRKVSVTGSSEGSNISENEMDSSESSSESSAAEFKGFKKRRINDEEKEKMVNNNEAKNQTVEKTNNDEKTVAEEVMKPKPVELRRSARNAANAKKNYSETNSVISNVTNNVTNSVETKEDTGDQLTEYAQYLGLQPTLKFKCGRCGEKHFQSMAALNAHQMVCCKTVSNVLTKQNKPPTETNLSTNFRITRKVYLCSACGTYYENWKLFLHMRDMHKRHICLFCLGMFSVAERLADHLLYQHNVHEKTCKSPEEFLNLFKGSCYLTCCSCEKMFTDREDFYDHHCKDSVSGSNRNNEGNTLTAKEIRELAQKCALCGVKCGHFRTCPKVAHKFQTMSPPIAGSPISNNSNNLERFYIPVNSKGQNNWPPNNLDQDILKQALSGSQSGDKDYYDAASFCHVDMAANDSDNVSSPSTPDENKSSDVKTKCDNDKCPRRLSDEITETTSNEEHTVENDRLTNDNLNSVSDSIDESNNQVDLKLDEKKCDESTRKVSSDNSSDLDTMDVEMPTEKEIEKLVSSPKVLQRFDEIDDVDSTSKGCQDNTTNDNGIARLDDVLKEDEVKNVPCSINPCDNVTCNAENSLSNNNLNETEDSVTDNEVINSESNHTGEESCSSIESSKLTNDISINSVSNSINLKENEETATDVKNQRESKCSPNDTDYETVQCSVRLDRLDDSLKYKSSSLKEDGQPEINSSNSNNDSDSSSSTSSSSNSSRRSSMDINDIDNTENNVESNEPILNTIETIPPTIDLSTKSISESDDEDDKELDFDNKINDNDVENDKTMSDSDNSNSRCNIDAEDSIQKSVEPFSSDTCNEMSKVASKEESESKDSDTEDNNTMKSVSPPPLDEPQDGDDSNSNSETSLKSQTDESCNNVDSHMVDINEENGVPEKETVVNDSKDDSNTEMEIDEDLHSNEGDLDDEEQMKEGDTTENNTEVREEPHKTLPPKEMSFNCDGVTIQLASEEVMAMALTLEDKMECLTSKCVVKECVRTSCTTCTYCSHAVKIGVNGKQLAIHLLTEHRYMPVKNETTEDVIERLKDSLAELQDVWFNTDSYDSSDKSCFVPHDHTYECFQCNYVTNTHKDLFSHKRKVHQKTILYCSMCKENFYSYSELLCHMCTGLYDATKDINFRCCLCDSDRIPSAFRLMVHLRKTHHTCDICLEAVDDQQKLSAHMVKHKLHHLCYRCGIAYRNKPDITKHLFWKHGTESVMCKKCLQKKWPHVYHFCVPPTAFICEECNLSFTKAVYLKVHKRFHNNNLPYLCEVCEQKFVSKKLLVKHEKTHKPPVVEEEEEEEKVDNTVSSTTKDPEVSVEQTETKAADEATNLQPEEPAAENCENSEKSNEAAAVKLPHKKKNKKDKDKKMKPVVDVYDLPPLNLSSDSDETDEEKEVKSTASVSKEEEDSEKMDIEPSKEESKDLDTTLEPDDKEHTDKSNEVESETTTTNPTEATADNEENTTPVTVVDGVWDSFHTYKAEQEKREHLDSVNKEALVIRHSVLDDHDYCLPNVLGPPEEQSGDDAKGHSSSMDHDYCSQNKNADTGGTSAGLITSTQDGEGTDMPSKKKQKSPKKKSTKVHNSSSSSDSSSDSDSSSCSCGTNCSCSSSSSNSSSSSSSDSDSSSSDGKHNSSNSKKEKKKEKSKSKKKGEVVSSTDAAPLVNEPVDVSIEPEEPLIRESDLDTDETATDEDFYDQYPQMRANQILSEKRNQLMMLAAVAPTVNNGTLSPPVSDLNTTNINLDPIDSPTKLEIVTPPITPTSQPQNKRKAKTKKRRKSSFSANKSRKSASEKNVQLETLPQPSTSSLAIPTMSIKTTPSESMTIYKQHLMSPNNGVAANMSPQVGMAQHASSNSSKRSSKRRRVRNKFYGYSSDEDAENQQTPPPIKWKKLTLPPTADSMKQMPQQPMNVHPQYNNTFQQHPVTPRVPPVNIRTVFENNQNNENASLKRSAAPTSSSSSSSSSEEDGSDSDEGSGRLMINPHRQMVAAHHHAMASTSEKDEKLYCYCQCPYDEVSEMIACDGIDCSIEWFHFECVGIMVPPKGKWYCPHCRKKRGLS